MHALSGEILRKDRNGYGMNLDGKSQHLQRVFLQHSIWNQEELLYIFLFRSIVFRGYICTSIGILIISQIISYQHTSTWILLAGCPEVEPRAFEPHCSVFMSPSLYPCHTLYFCCLLVCKHGVNWDASSPDEYGWTLYGDVYHCELGKSEGT